jgi:putative DNA methylase
VNRAKATCPACDRVLAPDRVRAQLRQQRGGADAVFDQKGERVGGARLLAVVTLKDEAAGRHYRIATNRDYEAVWKAQKAIKKLGQQKLTNGLSVIPDEALPAQGTLGFRVQLYGMTRWGDLFTARQAKAISSLGTAVRSYECNARRALGCAVSRVAMSAVSLTRWNAYAEKMQHTFGRQALPIVWDFSEVAPLADAPGNWQSG